MKFEDVSGLEVEQLVLLLGAATIEEVAPGELAQYGADDTDTAVLKHLEEGNETNRSLMLDIGFGVLTRVSARLHQRVCGDAKNELQTQISEAKKKGSAAVAAILVAALMDMGLSLTVATIISTVIATDVLDAAGEEFCERWSAFNNGLAARK